jgi:hypothetical protein
MIINTIKVLISTRKQKGIKCIIKSIGKKMCLRSNDFFFAFLFSKLSHTFQSALMELASITLAVLLAFNTKISRV